ncbi:uncharacterized protein MELLADRAFT_108873 [Melampsora larici-populina 98AG31]|uniref:Uncharacterized protein n=1 Tax=Melampsora larici-populina (strain 98AG31 / pathotype 3-4-7) TaxID=747676 RepID=F4RUJ8_MELLP|nr:uncharacterized protein MELLADRAFT_108873 [Melampsora larici-populina 98AG31]EGG03945.1 hypothetical protein MELLADRAFT_108873 [Melampsora larici-populina 98AG31]
MDNNSVRNFNEKARQRMLTRKQASNQQNQEDDENGSGSGEQNVGDGQLEQTNKTINQKTAEEELEDDELGGNETRNEEQTGRNGEVGGGTAENMINIPGEDDEEEESPEILLRHNKWINNMRLAFDRNETAKLTMLQTQYTRWCGAQQTAERDPMFDEFVFEDIIEKPGENPTIESRAEPVTSVSRTKTKIASRMQPHLASTSNLNENINQNKSQPYYAPYNKHQNQNRKNGGGYGDGGNAYAYGNNGYGNQNNQINSGWGSGGSSQTFHRGNGGQGRGNGSGSAAWRPRPGIGPGSFD